MYKPQLGKGHTLIAVNGQITYCVNLSSKLSGFNPESLKRVRKYNYVVHPIKSERMHIV
jgi:hypothetical protein